MKPEVVLGVITVVMAVVGGIVSVHAPSQLAYKVAYIVTFIVLGCCALVFVIRQSRESAKSETELNNKIEQLSHSSARIAGLQEQNNELQTKILDLARSNASLAKESISTVTGGDSFCYMNFSYQFGMPTPVLIHSGKYPLYDVQVRITDLNKFRRKVELHQPLDLSSDINLTIGELQVGRVWINRGLAVPFSDERAQDFNIFFSARNGIWTEILRLRKVGNSWSPALRVRFSPTDIPNPPAKPAFEQVPKDFPRNADGLVDWDK